MILTLLAACGRASHDSGKDSDPGTVDTAETGDSGDSGDSDSGNGGCNPDGDVFVELMPHGVDPILVFDVTVDPVARRAWSTALITPTLAEVDLDSGALVKVHLLGDQKLDRPQVSVGGDGHPWISSGAGYAVSHLDPATDQTTHPAPELDDASMIVARSDGGAWVAGEAAGQAELLWLGPDDSVQNELDLDDPAIGVAATVDGNVAALLSSTDGGGQHITVYDGDTLEPTLDCSVPPSDKFFTQLEDGSFVTVTETTITRVPCDGGDFVTIGAGQDNKETIAWNGGFVVLDREGDASTGGPNWGQVRYYDTDLNELPGTFESGKHSGYGALDPTTGIVWANSEGTTSIYPLDLQNHTALPDTQVGYNIETLVPLDDEPGSAILTGRLSGTVAKVNLCDGTFAEEENAPTWPISPTLAEPGTMYTIDQLTQTIQVWTTDPLEWVDTIDLGLPENTLLNFDWLLYDGDRNALFMTDTMQNELHEIDLSSRTIVQSWPLAGTPITDRTVISRDEIERVGDHLLVARPHDGQLTLIDPDQTVPLATGALDPASIKIIRTDRLDLVYVPEAQDRAYIGPIAIDPDTLETTGDDLPSYVDAVFADDGDGGLWTYSYDQGSVLHFDAGGTLIGTQSAEISDQGEPSFHIDAGWGGRLFYSDFEHATIHGTPVE